jgi:hypothetical protein
MVTSVLANAPPNAGSAGPVIACRMAHDTPEEMLLAADESRTGPTDHDAAAREVGKEEIEHRQKMNLTWNHCYSSNCGSKQGTRQAQQESLVWQTICHHAHDCWATTAGPSVITPMTAGPRLQGHLSSRP